MALPTSDELDELALRFSLGTRVECRAADAWRPGTIVQHFYTQASFQGRYAPYQIRLDDGRLIYAPKDEDTCIRAATQEDEESMDATAERALAGGLLTL